MTEASWEPVAGGPDTETFSGEEDAETETTNSVVYDGGEWRLWHEGALPETSWSRFPEITVQWKRFR